MSLGTLSSTSTQDSSAPPASTETHSSSLAEPLLGEGARLSKQNKPIVTVERVSGVRLSGLSVDRAPAASEDDLVVDGSGKALTARSAGGDVVRSTTRRVRALLLSRRVERIFFNTLPFRSSFIFYHSTRVTAAQIIIFLELTHTQPSNMPSRRPKRPCTRHLLPWGYDAPRPDNLSLDEFIAIITKEDDSPSSEIKNVLIYWDRGDLDKGDEAKLKEMQINSNALFAHVLDGQEWFRDRYPKGDCGREKHNLGEAACMMGVEVTTQTDLEELTDTEREYKLGAMRHNGAGDSDLTVRVNAELILLRIAELNAADGRRRKINGKYCFWGLDFEGGGHIGQGTTEIGLTKLWASDLEELGQDYWAAVSSRHAIILESFDDHLCRKAQEGKIAIDDRLETYPRWNFRGGPNTTEKCAYIFQAAHNTPPKLFNISIDSEVISQTNVAWWIVHQIPLRHSADEQVANVEFSTIPLHADAYPRIAIVDSQNEALALRLAEHQRQRQGQVPSYPSRPYRDKKRRPRVEEGDWSRYRCSASMSERE
ncbi:hypothetical protein KCU65_g343, partial [Aureobasidium melanogenum]